MLNILLLTTELRPGGAEKCLSHLARHLDSTQFNPRVVSIRSRPPQPESRLISQLENEGIPVHFLDCNSTFASFRAVARLKKLVRDHKIDIVQSFLFHANVLAGIVSQGFPKLRLFTGIRVAEPKRTRHWIERWFTSQTQKIICVSESVRQFAEQIMGFPAAKLVAIPNSVEAPDTDSTFDPATLGIQKPFFLFVGRLEEQKGLGPFLEAFAEQEANLPEYELVFAGEGSQRDSLKRLARSINRACHFVGWQESPQNLMQHAAALILPSLWEGMPNVILEAMSMKLPFVAFGVDGVSEIVPERDVQVIEPGNYREFLDRMSQFLTDKALAKEVAEKNQSIIAENYSLKKMIADYEQIYLAPPDPPD